MMTYFPNTTQREKRIAKGKDNRKSSQGKGSQRHTYSLEGELPVGERFSCGEDWGSYHVPFARQLCTVASVDPDTVSPQAVIGVTVPCEARDVHKQLPHSPAYH